MFTMKTTMTLLLLLLLLLLPPPPLYQEHTTHILPLTFDRNLRGFTRCYEFSFIYTVSEKDCTLFYFFFLGAQCVESGVSCTDCY